MRPTLTIPTWGGLGDVLREISQLPVEYLFRRWGLRCRIRHLPTHLGNFRPEAACPGAEVVRDLVKRLPACTWGGEGIPSGPVKPLVRIIRNALEMFPSGRGLFRPEFHWEPEDVLPEGFDPGKGNLVLQTHLAGLSSKRWPVENWRQVLQELRSRFPSLSLHVLDPAGGDLAMPGVRVYDCLSVPQAIRLVASADGLLSVDSWSKYVAAWHHIPQIILVPDQTSDYPQLTASSVWRHSFRGLQASPEVQLLGLEPKSRHEATYTLGRLENFSVAQVVEAAAFVCRHSRVWEAQ